MASGQLLLLVTCLLFSQYADCHMFGKDVTELTPATINKYLKTEKPVMMMFYAPWCGHCKAAVGPWGQAAGSLKDMVKFAAVDADKHKELGGRYGVKGFPTIKTWNAGKKGGPQDYQGARDAKAFTNAGVGMIQGKVTTLKGAKSLETMMAKAETHSALLFSDKTTVPYIFKALSGGTQWKDKVPFGFVSKASAKEIVKQFGISKFPTVMVLDKEMNVVDTFTGTMKYMPIAKWLQPIVKGEGGDATDAADAEDQDGKADAKEKKPEKKESKPKPAAKSALAQLEPEDFLKQCKGSRKLCVVGFGESAQEAMSSFAKMKSSDKKVAVFHSTDAKQLEGFSVMLKGDASSLGENAIVAVKQSKSGDTKYAQFSKDASADALVDWVGAMTVGEVQFTRIDMLPFDAVKGDPADEGNYDAEEGAGSL